MLAAEWDRIPLAEIESHWPRSNPTGRDRIPRAEIEPHWPRSNPTGQDRAKLAEFESRVMADVLGEMLRIELPSGSRITSDQTKGEWLLLLEGEQSCLTAAVESAPSPTEKRE